jgi:hypothetical protein
MRPVSRVKLRNNERDDIYNSYGKFVLNVMNIAMYSEVSTFSSSEHL